MRAREPRVGTLTRAVYAMPLFERARHGGTPTSAGPRAGHDTPVFDRWRAAKAATLPGAALLATAIGDTAQVPGSALAQHLWNPLALLCHSLGQALEYCWPQLLSGVVLTVLLFSRPRTSPLRQATALLAGMMGLLSAVAVCFTLATYPPFLEPPLVLAALAAFSLVCAGAPLALSRGPRWLANAVALAGAIGFSALSIGNPLAFKNLYPSLHLAATQASLVFAGWVALRWLIALEAPQSTPQKLALTVFGAAPWVLGALALLGAFESERPLLRSHTALGRARSAYGIDVAPRQRVYTMGHAPEGDAAYFRAHSKLPLLEGIDLDRFDVLFISSEATRYDHTSSGDPRSDLTPRLRELVAEGAFDFTRAYSASTGTLQSMSAIMGMGMPSSLYLEVRLRRWHGRLFPRQDTVAEAVRADGRSTFWIGHNNNEIFGNGIVGLEQGFDRVDLGGDDESIRQRAVQQITELQALRRRFFGWVFFVAPHHPYDARFSEMPASTSRDRYRQEVRYMDVQLGALLDALRASKTLDTTLIVFTGDHGEEFGEHGGRFHKTTVYTEVCHVPLVVWIPGMQGRRITEPVSNAHVLPWLLLTGSAHGRQAAAGAIERLVPMMRASKDAVAVELLGYDRALVSLIYPHRKINTDLFAASYESFDPRIDPLEQRSLPLTGSAEEVELMERMNDYLDVRQQLQRFTFDPVTIPSN